MNLFHKQSYFLFLINIFLTNSLLSLPDSFTAQPSYPSFTPYSQQALQYSSFYLPYAFIVTAVGLYHYYTLGILTEKNGSEIQKRAKMMRFTKGISGGLEGIINSILIYKKYLHAILSLFKNALEIENALIHLESFQSQATEIALLHATERSSATYYNNVMRCLYTGLLTLSPALTLLMPHLYYCSNNEALEQEKNENKRSVLCLLACTSILKIGVEISFSCLLNSHLTTLKHPLKKGVFFELLTQLQSFFTISLTQKHA